MVFERLIGKWWLVFFVGLLDFAQQRLDGQASQFLRLRFLLDEQTVLNPLGPGTWQDWREWRDMGIITASSCERFILSGLVGTPRPGCSVRHLDDSSIPSETSV